MKTPFASAMSQALSETRAGNAARATEIIQAALGGTTMPAAQPTSAATPDATVSRTRLPLGRTIDLLSLGQTARGPQFKGRAPRIPDTPAGTRYERHQHVSAQGSLSYTIFVPSARDEQVRGLIVMLHGCTQDADDFAAGTQMNVHAERENLLVAYPEQTRSANQMGCWNWFRPQDQQRGSGEPALLADLAEHLREEWDLAPGRVFVAGLSAGGAMAAILGASYGDVFSAVGVHSGLAPGTARDVASAFAAMKGQTQEGLIAAAPVRTIVFHGTSDQTVHRGNADRVVAAAIGATKAVVVTAGSDASSTLHLDVDRKVLAEIWSVDGLGHAWSGGSPAGTYTAPGGPDASAEMVRFFLDQSGANAN